VWDGWHAGVRVPGAIARTPTAGVVGQPVSDGHYKQADWSGMAGTIRHCKHAIWDDQSAGAGTVGAAEYTRIAGVTKHLGMAGAAGYVDAAGNTVPIGTTGVTRYAARGGPACTIRQHASDWHYEPTICNGVNYGYDTTGITNGARGVTRQTDPAWVDVVAGSEQDSGISKVISQLSRQVTGLPRPVGIGVDPVHVPSWSHCTASWSLTP